jgi:hypothetical protein
MLSNRTIKFLTAAILIAVAVFSTSSLTSIAPLVGETQVDTTAFQSINPELMAAQRYADMVAKPTSASWVANPELNVANRFAAVISSVSYSANPELVVASRYTPNAFRVLSSSFLATNPEIMAHLRYAIAN